jgi:crotonobetainyl-CoA:carnitine CoA-transferase CaiB-like acyl-CoA transferase
MEYTMSMILEGIRVVELALLQIGPYPSAMLGSLGAEVLKVEEPGVGDAMRGLTTMLGISMQTPDGRSITFEDGNYNKKGIALDLKKPQGKEILYKLIEKSDVFVTNYRESALKRMGVDYETLRKYNPRLIYAYASGFGTKGPDKDLPAIDLIGQARSGIMMQSGEQGMGPVYLPQGVCDRITSIFLAYGIIAALLARERLGVGQKVEASMLSALTNLQGFAMAPFLMLGRGMPRWDRKSAANPIHNYYQCKDKRWIVIAMWQGDRYFPPFCKLLGRPDLLKDPRFAGEAKRWENREALISILDDVFATKTSGEWLEILRKEDILFSLVKNYDEVFIDPQMIANEDIVDWNHPVLGPIKYYGFPVKFSETPMKYKYAAPEVGQHTEEVLQDILGYNWEQIVQMREAGAI